MRKFWHTKKIIDIFKELDSDERGLFKTEAKKRLTELGKNKLPEAKAESLAVIFLHQFQSPLIYVLLIASFLVLFLNHITDFVIIMLVLIINAVIGAVQEGKAQSTLMALKKFVKTEAIAIRDGKETVVADEELVPGDIIILNEGDKVPADARLIIANDVKINQSSLTGESIAVHKTAKELSWEDTPIAEQENMIFKGMEIVGGNAKAIIVATGLKTHIGAISQEVALIDTEIPLKKKTRSLYRVILLAVLLISVMLFFSGLKRGIPLDEIITTVVSLAVSIIPEGLPIVVTLMLARGVWNMSKKNVLIKRMQAVEGLGLANIIAVDKTGTLTKNEITVSDIYINDKYFSVGGLGYEPKGDIIYKTEIIDPLNHADLIFLGKITAFCSGARTIYNEETKIWQVFGDPTEAAIGVLAEKIGFRKDELVKESPKISEIPFDYKNRYHATIHKVEKSNLLTVAGAPEKILDLSNKIWINGESQSMSEKESDQLWEIFEGMSQKSLRVLAMSVKSGMPQAVKPDEIKNLTFVGFLGMQDTIRPEVAQAMANAKEAGIKVVMITGDNELTAREIARQAGIFKEGDEVISGHEINNMNEDALVKKLDIATVFARVSPEHKMKIINAYKKRGDLVAMTGDGVNDAPSLVSADLGVAMGRIGTDVAKEAADIILLDDNFGNIIYAVEEGRNIYKSLKKVILYLLSTSFGEVMTIMTAIFLGFPLPLVAAQIIWLNLVTDGFQDVALAMEPKEENLLRVKLKKFGKYLLDAHMIIRILVMGATMAIGTLFLFKNYIGPEPEKGWTIALTVLAIFQWFNAYNCRHESMSIFKMKFFENKFLLWATSVSVVLQIVAVYLPFMQKILRTTAISLGEWLICIAVGSSIIFVEEIRKLFYRKIIS